MAAPLLTRPPAFDLYLDAEFNSFGGELISLALVGQGVEFYEVVGVPASPHPWVARHVLPHLDKPGLGYEGVRAYLHWFLAQIPDHNIRVFADWPEDFGHFFPLLCSCHPGEALAKTIVAVLANPPRQPVPAQPHNALSDARALRAAWAA